MAQKLDANLNVIQETPIELELINGDLSIISKLDDEPNDVGGLTSTQLKAKFDEAGNIIKEYLNESLIPAVLAADATEATRSAAEAERVENELERVANENVRVPAETARIAAENIRIENEATRVASEEERIAAEATRKSNEAQRIINENAREDLETGYVARAEAAAKRAEDAAADAENTVGGDYVTQEELDAAIGAIPTPDVYTKTETLTNDTKALFGLGADAVPDGAFRTIANNVFCYRWKKTAATFTETHSTTSNSVTLYAGFVIEYSSTITVDADGKAFLVNPSSVTVASGSASSAHSKINNKYVSIVQKGSGGSSGSYSMNTVYYFVGSSANANSTTGYYNPLTITLTKSNDFEIVFSKNVDAHEDGLLVNGYIFELLGKLGDANCKIAVGTYAGTGTYGSNNKSSLSFEFVPKLLLITGVYGRTDGPSRTYISGLENSSNDIKAMFLHFYNFSTTEYEVDFASNTRIVVSSSSDGKTVYWYSNASDYGAAQQMNGTGWTYRYLAIG